MKEILIQLIALLELLLHGNVTTYQKPVPTFTPIEQIYQKPTGTPLTVKLKVTDAEEAWLQELILCESSGNPEAINPLDLDGTPSFGLLQFKPSTFHGYRKQYGLPEKELMDPEAQKDTVRHMMQDPWVDWYQQFPACTRRLGEPPVLN